MAQPALEVDPDVHQVELLGRAARPGRSTWSLGRAARPGRSAELLDLVARPSYSITQERRLTTDQAGADRFQCFQPTASAITSHASSNSPRLATPSAVERSSASINFVHRALVDPRFLVGFNPSVCQALLKGITQ